MKRNLILLLAAIGIVAVLMIIGNVLVIGERLARIHAWLEYVFYAFIGLLLTVYVLLPVIRVLRTSPLPPLDEETLADATPAHLRAVGMMLAKNNGYISDKAQRKAHREALTAFLAQHKDCKERIAGKLTEELEKRFCEMNTEIRNQALTAFLITGLSQNGKFDFITTLGINFRMIGRLVALSGFRPTYLQLVKLYASVLSASFITYFSEEMLDDIDFTALANTLRLPGILVSSLMDGALTALMTLRIGYITKKYIQSGSRGFDKKAARRYGIRNARKEIPEVVKAGGAKLREYTVSGFASLWKKKNPFAKE